MKDSFILYTEQKEIFESLSDEQAGKLIKNIFKYIEEDKEPELEGILKIAFIPIRQNIDRNNDKWEDIRQKRSEAGKKHKGNQYREWNKMEQTEQNGTNGTVNVNDNVNVNVNVNDNNNAGESCVDGLAKVIGFYNNNIGAITPYGANILQDYLKDFEPEVIIYAMQISVEANKRTIQYIKAILNNWVKAGVKNLTEAREESKKKAVITKKEKGYEGRDYTGFDFNTLLANEEE